MTDNQSHIEPITPPPWAGFWFEVANFLRKNTLFLFAALWFLPVPTYLLNIYLKVLFLSVAFVLDRIAVRKADDIAITSLAEMDAKFEEALNQPADVTELQKKELWHWLKIVFGLFLLIFGLYSLVYFLNASS